jgi:hypothetical protein
LIRGFIEHLAEAWGGDKDNQDNQKESKKVIEDPFGTNDAIVYLHRCPLFQCITGAKS